MTRRVDYVTARASDIYSPKWLVLLLEFTRRGFTDTRYGEQIAADYALESPTVMPAGACVQCELEPPEDDHEDPPHYVVMAEQMECFRDD